MALAPPIYAIAATRHTHSSRCVDGVNLERVYESSDATAASQVVLATHTVGEALFTIDRPLVVKIIESRTHR